MNHPRYRVSRGGEILLDGSLKEAVEQAIIQCPGADEEEGGILLINPKQEEAYEFIKLANRHTGEACAVAFFEAHPAEYGEKVISRFNAGLRNYASFHTHPTGCRALPSMVDLTRLFNGFPKNYIWSPSLGELNLFTFSPTSNKDEVHWEMQTILRT